MLRYSLVFLALALLFGLLGFTAVAGEPLVVARVFFFLFFVLFVVTLTMGEGPRAFADPESGPN